MKILVVGGGAREHALVWKLKDSPAKHEIYCAPGNAGIAEMATCVDIATSDIEGLRDFAVKHAIDLTVVGPEAPLVAGITDLFQEKGLVIFGPTRAAAELEGSKVLAKEIMARHGIPTAAHRVFAAPEPALAYVAQALDFPMVIKASGLAAGKGVVICRDRATAERTVREMMVERAFGDAGDEIIIEDFLDGEEVSVMALTDTHTILVLESSQDHKRAFDNDEGPNTGGMGAYSPAPCLTPELQSVVERDVLVPIVHAMKQEKRKFQGLIYCGLMLTKRGPKVLEFNVRFGDPECEVLMARFRGDLAETLRLCATGKLRDAQVEVDPRPAVCVVVAQQGYPGPVTTGQRIRGLPKPDPAGEVMVFHGATRIVDGELVAWGGRVLCVTALGRDFKDAATLCYEAIAGMTYPDSHYRKDIASRVIGKRR
jgi:phosphoribosylamine---glycine ligase